MRQALAARFGLFVLALASGGAPLALAGGTLLAIYERGLDARGDVRAFLIGGPSPGGFQ